MSRLETTLRAIARDLDDIGAAWALVGGLAVSTLAEPRLTRDVDLAISVADDAAAEQIVWQLQQKGYVVQTVIEHIPTGRLGTARLFPPRTVAKGIYVDLLFASCGIEAEIVAAATSRDIFPDIEVPVVSIGQLVAMKLLAFDARDRPQDLDDIRSLLENASAADIADVTTSISLITERGFDRGKNLRQSFERVQKPPPRG